MSVKKDQNSGEIEGPPYELRDGVVTHLDLLIKLTSDPEGFPPDLYLLFLYGTVGDKSEIVKRIFPEYRRKHSWHTALKRLKKLGLIEFSSVDIHRIESEKVRLTRRGETVLEDWKECGFLSLFTRVPSKYLTSCEEFIRYFRDNFRLSTPELKRESSGYRKESKSLPGKGSIKIALSCPFCGSLFEAFISVQEYESLKKVDQYFLNCDCHASEGKEICYYVDFQANTYDMGILYDKSYNGATSQKEMAFLENLGLIYLYYGNKKVGTMRPKNFKETLRPGVQKENQENRSDQTKIVKQKKTTGVQKENRENHREQIENLARKATAETEIRNNFLGIFKRGINTAIIEAIKLKFNRLDEQSCKQQIIEEFGLLFGAKFDVSDKNEAYQNFTTILDRNFDDLFDKARRKFSELKAIQVRKRFSNILHEGLNFVLRKIELSEDGSFNENLAIELTIAYFSYQIRSKILLNEREILTKEFRKYIYKRESIWKDAFQKKRKQMKFIFKGVSLNTRNFARFIEKISTGSYSKKYFVEALEDFPEFEVNKIRITAKNEITLMYKFLLIAQKRLTSEQASGLERIFESWNPNFKSASGGSLSTKKKRKKKRRVRKRKITEENEREMEKKGNNLQEKDKKVIVKVKESMSKQRTPQVQEKTTELKTDPRLEKIRSTSFEKWVDAEFSALKKFEDFLRREVGNETVIREFFGEFKTQALQKRYELDLELSSLTDELEINDTTYQYVKITDNILEKHEDEVRIYTRRLLEQIKALKAKEIAILAVLACAWGFSIVILVLTLFTYLQPGTLKPLFPSTEILALWIFASFAAIFGFPFAILLVRNRFKKERDALLRLS